MEKKAKIALVVQGGSMRSVYTTGVLDAFTALNFKPFDYYVAVSGGAMSLSYFLSGQFRTSFNIMRELSEDSKFINVKNIFTEEGLVNLEYLEKFTQKKYPLDVKRAFEFVKDKMFEVVATDMSNGEPVYLKPGLKNWLRYLRASASLPFFSKGVCHIDGKKLMDGGWSDAIPVHRSIEKGATKIVVIRTLPKFHKENWSYFGVFGGWWHRNNPGLARRFSHDHIYYNEVVEFLNREHEGIDIYQIAPEKYLRTSSYSSSLQKIEDDYRLGLDAGLQFVAQNRYWLENND